MATWVPTSLIQLFDDSGDPLNGGSVTVYAATTTTPLSLFSNEGLSTPAANPIILDSAGRHAIRYFATASYKLLIKNSSGSTVFERDSIDPGIAIGTGDLPIADGGTGASTAPAALANLGAATAAELADLAADVAALTGALGSSEKTHLATGTTAQRPATPVEGDVRRNTTIPQWEGYNGTTWDEFAVQLDVTTEIAAAIAANVGWVKIQTQVAAASAVVDFTTGLNDTYDAFEIRISSVKPVTDDVELWLRIGTGGGPTYEVTLYDWSINATHGAASNGSSGSDAKIVMSQQGAGVSNGNAAGEHGVYTVRFSNPETTDSFPVRFDGVYISADGNPRSCEGNGMWKGGTGPITGIRFLFESGNISSGRFTLYGLLK